MSGELAIDELERLVDGLLGDKFPIGKVLERVAADRDPELQVEVVRAGLLELAVPGAAGGPSLPASGVATVMLAAGRGRMPAALRDAILVLSPVLAIGAAEGSVEPTVWEDVRTGRKIGAGRAGALEGGPVHLLRGASVLAVVSPGTSYVLSIEDPAIRLDRIVGLDLGQGLHSLSLSVSYAPILSAEASAGIYRMWLLGVLAEAAGCAERALEMARGYALERKQFGRPIARFQAIAHLLANMKADVETCRSAIAMLAGAIEAGDDVLADDLGLAFSYSIPRAAREVCEGAIQVHGGVGFTWELGLHLYYRRALSTQALLGGAYAAAVAVGHKYMASVLKRANP